MISNRLPHMRLQVQNVTRDVHDALHNDAVLRQLSSPKISPAAYTTALTVFAIFYHAVERTRAQNGIFNQFSLQPECAALSKDLDRHIPTCRDLDISSTFGCLGALYVAHGASFGRNSFRANVVTQLHDHPHSFVRLGMDKGKWGDLLVAMDTGRSNADRLEIQTGAACAFSFIQDIAHAHNTRPLPPPA